MGKGNGGKKNPQRPSGVKGQDKKAPSPGGASQVNNPGGAKSGKGKKK